MGERYEGATVSMAVGAEYRKDTIDAASDPLSQTAGWFAVNPKPLSGDVNVKEGYAEVVVPLLRDKPAAYSLDVNGAGRLTDYSTSGQVTAWKAGINYSPLADLRFRATVSRDIRAPSINELYSAETQQVTALVDPRNNSNPTVTQLIAGNPALEPETSKAYTVGLVFQPGWVRGLRMSVDYYSFDITNAIASLNGQQFLDGCFTLGQQALCSAIVQNASGVITRINGTLLNAAATKSSGIDAELGYDLPIGAGKMDFRLLGTYVDELATTISGRSVDIVDQI